MFQDSLEIGSEPLPYFRTSEFSQSMKEIKQDYLELLEAGENAEMAVLTASGTGAMEAAVMNGLTENDKVLVINGGGFGERFVQLCRIHKIPYDELKLEFCRKLEPEMLLPYEDKGYTALLVNIHETTTGQLYPAQMLGDFCRRNNMFFIVDAISSFLADEFHMAENGADMVITASQKALALAPGLSFVTVSRRMYERIMNADVNSMYFDLKDYFKNMERGQTPFTPAVGTILQLKRRLEILKEQGIAASVEACHSRAVYFRDECRRIGLQIPDMPLSNALTPVLFPDQNAYEVFEALRNRYDITVTPNGGALAKTVLRIGHIGNLNQSDLKTLIECMQEVME